MRKTRCNFCNDVSAIQQPGNLCHSCQRGYMVMIEKFVNSQRLTKKQYFDDNEGSEEDLNP